jgi:hypothetical protein
MVLDVVASLGVLPTEGCVPTSRVGAAPLAPPGPLLGPGGTQLLCAKAAEPDRTIAQAVISEIFVIGFLLRKCRQQENVTWKRAVA